ncbi:MAG TPA: SGNH hydrolase domain-containing protein [Rhizomicrobium sp.]|nr:SGNH hydrolase domain-containing protein [Rhizomicrobium sp.]
MLAVVTAAAYLVRQKFVPATFDRLKRMNDVRVLFPREIPCASGWCEAALNGVPLYRDAHHLSVFGARQLIPMMRQAF